MSGKAIRREFLPRFRGLPRHSRARAGLILASYFLQITLAIALGARLVSSGTGTGIAAAAVVAAFIATRLRGLNNIVHECSHATFVRDPANNETFGKIAAALTLGSFGAYRKAHLTHHSHLGDHEKDLDFKGIQAFRFETPLTARTLCRHIVTPVVGLHLPVYARPDLSVRDGALAAALKLAILFAACCWAVADPLTAAILFLLPWFWLFPAINYWTDCVDHAGLWSGSDSLHTARNAVLPLALRWLLFPRNDCYHLIHHLFPGIPSQHLPACHGTLLENSAYRRAQRENRLIMAVSRRTGQKWKKDGCGRELA
ncbi:MAG: fatty acid desaturase [Paracoccaceae bacterium]|nr:fatty acid desaturase [Paracoccaceae bacterium]